MQTILKSEKKKLKSATLCFLIRNDEVLLAVKKRGFGKDKWNGAGGKTNPGESVKHAAVRETQEEIGVTPLSLERKATLNFRFLGVPEDKDWDQKVTVFLAEKWNGIPSETEEMSPKWFKKDQLPFAEMWPDDPLWLPLVLKGKKVNGDFYFDAKQKLIEYKIRIA